MQMRSQADPALTAGRYSIFKRLDHGRPYVMAANCPGYCVAHQDRYAGGPHSVDSGVARRLRPRVHQSGDAHSRVVKLQRGSVALVIHGRHNRSLAWLDAVKAGQPPGSVGQHDPGPVVRVEHQGLLDHAGCDHNAPGSKLDQPVRGQYTQQVVFIESERRRAGENRDTIERRHLARQVSRSLIRRNGVRPMDGGVGAEVSAQSRASSISVTLAPSFAAASAADIPAAPPPTTATSV